jgi:hypothetical protein
VAISASRAGTILAPWRTWNSGLPGFSAWQVTFIPANTAAAAPTIGWPSLSAAATSYLRSLPTTLAETVPADPTRPIPVLQQPGRSGCAWPACVTCPAGRPRPHPDQQVILYSTGGATTCTWPPPTRTNNPDTWSPPAAISE